MVDDGHALTERDIVVLLRARGVDFDAVCSAADSVRRAVNGDTVTYVVNRNINYTNVCTYKYGMHATTTAPHNVLYYC